MSLREEKLEFAEGISKKTVEVEPYNSTYLDTYAWILFKLERYNDALLYIKRAYDNGGNQSQVIVEHYGDIQFIVGEVNAAIELWQMSKDMGNNNESLIRKIEKRSLD